MAGRTEDAGFTSEWVFRHCAETHRNLSETVRHTRDATNGRFHPQGEFGAIYVACEEATALAELDHRAERTGIDRSEMLPRLMLTLHVRLQRILDLSDESTRTAWGTDLDEITRADDYVRCHEIARIARRDGYEAIRFPAVGGAGENYAVFFDQLKPGSELEIVAEKWL